MNPRFADRAARRDTPARVVSRIAAALLIAATIVAANRVYFVSELLVSVVLIAVFTLVATSAVLLVVLLQGCVRWGIRQIGDASRRAFIWHPAIKDVRKS